MIVHGTFFIAPTGTSSTQYHSYFLVFTHDFETVSQHLLSKTGKDPCYNFFFFQIQTLGIRSTCCNADSIGIIYSPEIWIYDTCIMLFLSFISKCVFLLQHQSHKQIIKIENPLNLIWDTLRSLAPTGALYVMMRHQKYSNFSPNATRVTLSHLNSINAIDVTREWH